MDAAKLARMQAITLDRLCRVYPSGLRVSSSNFPPLQAWRAGAQCVAVNLQTNDLTAQVRVRARVRVKSSLLTLTRARARARTITSNPTQLHHALFEGSDGYVLKPKAMRAPAPDWPPISLTLERVTLKVLCLGLRARVWVRVRVRAHG